MHVWWMRIKYRGAIGWHTATFEVLASDGPQALAVLEARFPFGCKLLEFLQLADEPRIVKHS